MKKFSKILCAVLMLALICTSLAFLVSADNTPDTVTQTVTGTDLGAVALSTIEGNALTNNPNFFQYQQKDDPNGDGVYTDGAATENTMVDAFVVQPNGGDGYGVFWAGENQNGCSFQNFQHTYSYNGVELTEDSYYVVDLDIATATSLISALEISLPNRNVKPDNSGWNGYPFGQNVSLKKWLPNLGEEWTHFTVVCSIKTNQQYIFVNGVFQGTTGSHAYNATQRTEGTALHANGMKLEVPYTASVNNTYAVFANESAAFDNLSRRDIVDAEGIAALDAIINSENKDLTQWAGYPTNVRTGSLPAYVEIDGVQYNNIAEANKVLFGYTAKTVNVLNSFPGRLTVYCDATINMNGCTGEIVSAEGATITEENGVVTVDAPVIASMTERHSASVTDAKLATAVDKPDNILKQFTYQNMNGLSQDGVTPGLYTYIYDYMGGSNQFLMYRGNPQINNSSNTYGEIQIMYDLSYNDGAAQYIVFDMDVAMMDGQVFPLMDIPRKNGSGMWGAANPHLNTLANSEIGKFQHLTLVYDLPGNGLYVYNNNTLVYENTLNGWTSADNHAAFSDPNAKWNFNGLRIGSNGLGTAAIDNVYARHITADSAVALKAAIDAKKITDWTGNVYTDDYELPKMGAALMVNGVEYISPTEPKLVGNIPAEVSILRPFTESIHIACDAVIETNGFEINYTTADGATVTEDGTKILVDVPVQPNVSYTHTNGQSLPYVVDKSTAGNFLSSITPSIANNGNQVGSDAERLIALEAVAGEDKYLVLRPDDSLFAGEYSENPFVYIERYGISDGSTQLDADSFYVIDLDVFTESEFIKDMTIAPTNRHTPNGSGFPFGVTWYFGQHVEQRGEWVHLTYVGDIEANEAHVFVNGEYKGMIGYSHRAQEGDNTPEQGIYACGFRFNLGAKVKGINDEQMVGIRNASERVYQSNEAAGDLKAAIAAGSLNGWVNNIVGYKGDVEPIVEIDGQPYADVYSASAALNNGGTHDVVYNHDFFGTITIGDTANVYDNKFAGKVVAKGEAVKIDDKTYIGYDMVVEGNKFIRLDGSNASKYAIPTLWYASTEDYESETTIYFPEGAQIEYIGEWTLNSNYIEDGKLYNQYWTDFTAKVTEFPVAEKNNEYYYAIESTTEDTALTVQKDLKYNMSLYANFDVNLYIPVANGVTGTVKTIGGVDHVLVSKSVAANAVDGDVVYYIDFTVDGVTYTEKVVVSILDYAEAVLASETVSDHMKRVMVAALEYANEVAKLLNGAESAAIAAIVTANEQYKVEDDTNYGEVNTDALAAVIEGAQLKLDSSVAFVLKVAAGYNGEIVIEYADYKGQQFKVTKTVKGGDVIVLDDFKIYNIDSTLTITAGEVTGTYNLGGYIKGLVEAGTDAEFAKALFTYAKVAQSYKAALNEAAKA